MVKLKEKEVVPSECNYFLNRNGSGCGCNEACDDGVGGSMCHASHAPTVAIYSPPDNWPTGTAATPTDRQGTEATN